MNGAISAEGRIVGVIAAVPRQITTNDGCADPAAAVEAARMTGVHARRRVTAWQSARTLCTAAARQLMGGVAWAPASVDVLIYVTQTPEGFIPADVYRIAADLGLPARCLCLQANWSCAGYVNGLLTAMRLIGPGQRALLLVGDAVSTIVDPADRATAPLFGDAGSATAIIGGGPLQHFVVGSDGTGADRLAQGPGDFLRMDGAAVFGFTLRRVPQLIADVVAHGAPDFLLFHQANAFMLEHLARKTRLLDSYRRDQLPTNIARFGNCSCASIPLLMATEIDHWLIAGPQRLALLGFGAGWAWAGAAITCDEPMLVADLIEED